MPGMQARPVPGPGGVPSANVSPAPAAEKTIKRPVPAAKPAGRWGTKRSRRPAGAGAIDPAKATNLLYGTMERLETLSSLYENLGLRVSTGTLKKAHDLDRAVNNAAAAYFKVPEPKPVRETLKNYRGLLDSALRSVKTLKELRGRMKSAETEPALLAARELYLAIDSDLADRKLILIAAEAGPPRPAGTAASRETGEELANETETLFTISEVTFALSAYRKEEGRFPKALKDLTPKYIPAIPAIAVAGHEKTDRTTEIDSSDYDANLSKVMKDTGAWLYFSNKKSRYYGRVFVDCTHKNAQGVEFYRIGEGK